MPKLTRACEKLLTFETHYENSKPSQFKIYISILGRHTLYYRMRAFYVKFKHLDAEAYPRLRKVINI